MKRCIHRILTSYSHLILEAALVWLFKLCNQFHQIIEDLCRRRAFCAGRSVLPSSSAAVLKLSPTPVMSYDVMLANCSRGTNRVNRSVTPSDSIARIALQSQQSCLNDL